MPQRIRAVAILSLGWLGALSAPLVGQAPPAAAEAAPAPAPPPTFKLSGYAEASYVYSTEAAPPNTIVGRLYDRYSDAFTLNALKLAVDRPYNAKKVDAGVHADVLIGENAAVLQSVGSGNPSVGPAGNTFNIGADGDVIQLYVTLNLPTKSGSGVQFKAGKFVTMMGVEVIEDVVNPNWSEGNQFIYVENFTATGVEVDLKPSSTVDAEFRIDNGWDRIVVTNGHKDFMARLGLAPSANTALGVVGYVGAQEPNSSAARYGVNVVLNQKMGSKTSVWLQGDWGKETANAALPDPTQDATWWALGGWLATDLSPKANLAVRADYMDDAEGARTSGAFGTPAGTAHKLWSLTGTLNVKTFPNVLLRPEVRYDHSNFPVFNGKSGQASVALSVAYLY